ncbi:hypothetical protein [Streptomyces sp. TP-A0874]|uniref:hypothetical protein n=1 Tax=Streptomyces sp. TP-A0874 TaxID=549819 RepID=UPI00147B92EE|nr:hypothetical protein [Streptomyces sp. TP-A0874]
MANRSTESALYDAFAASGKVLTGLEVPDLPARGEHTVDEGLVERRLAEMQVGSEAVL